MQANPAITNTYAVLNFSPQLYLPSQRLFIHLTYCESLSVMREAVMRRRRRGRGVRERNGEGCCVAILLPQSHLYRNLMMYCTSTRDRMTISHKQDQADVAAGNTTQPFFRRDLRRCDNNTYVQSFGQPSIHTLSEASLSIILEYLSVICSIRRNYLNGLDWKM